MSYSLYERVQDHIITAPRWYHHAQVKAGLSITVAFVALVLTMLIGRSLHIAALAAATLGGPGVFAVAVGLKVAHGARSWSYWAPKLRDQAVDLSDALWATAGCLILAGYPIYGALLAGLCLSTFLAWHKVATP